MIGKKFGRGAPAVFKRTLAVVVSAALVVMGVPVVAHVAEEADEKLVVEAYAASGKVLTATVPAEVDGNAAIDVAFTITGDDTCEVGRSNSSGETTYAVASGYTGGIVIPQEVVYVDSSGTESTYTVTSVQSYAFGNVSSSDASSCSLSSVVIPYTVETVGSYAFCGCENLEEILFSGNDENPAAIEEIGSYAFAYTPVESICFPNSLVSLGQCSFRECTELETVDFEDPEESALEYLAGTSSGNSSTGIGAFMCSESNPGSLESITLPAGLKSVPPSSFAYQTELEEVIFLGDSVNYIGTYAFYECSSLVEFTIPELAGYTGSAELLLDYSLCGLDSLETLIFLGDADGDDYSSAAFDEMPSLETVVYWGEPYGGGVSGGGQSESLGTAEKAFGDDVDYYFNVEFYESESDAENAVDELASARLYGDMTVGELRDVLAGDAEFEDGDVYDDGGAVPDDSADWYWAFEEGYVDSDDLFGGPSSWRCDKDADEVDIASCRITLTTTAFTRALEAVDVSDEYEVLTPDGSEEVSSDCYTVYAVGYSTGDENDPDAETTYTTYDDITDLIEEGSYQLWFEAVEGSGYTGSTYAEFTISTTDVDFYAYPGESGWARDFTSNVYDGSGEYDMVVVASGGDVYGAAAAQWLASASDSAFLVLPEDEVPDTNESNYFNAAINNLLGDGTNGKVYVVGDEDAVSEEAEEALETSRVTSVERLDYSDEDAPAQVWRTMSQEYESGTTAYIAVADDDSCAEAAAATQLAYADACPVFFCDEDGELDSYTRFVLKTGHFDEIVAVGGDDAALEQIKYQVSDDASYSLEEGTAQDHAYEAVDEYYENHEKDTSMKAILASVDEGDEAYAIMAAVVASESDAALFLAEGESEVEEAIPANYLGEDVAARTETMAFMGESEFLDDAQVYLSSLWDIEDEEEE